MAKCVESMHERTRGEVFSCTREREKKARRMLDMIEREREREREKMQREGVQERVRGEEERSPPLTPLLRHNYLPSRERKR